MPIIRRTRAVDPESAKLTSRLLAALPAATFEMETFTRLAGVVANTRIPTAAMECTHRPRLLLNPTFIAEYCRRDEHLFLLVMHELWHVLLAHTSLYPRVTQAQNIAFDAIINAGLIRQFNAPEYLGFFERLNPHDQFPHLLLRPPVGWPDNPQYTNLGPEGTQRVQKQLYPPPGLFKPPMPFYKEILDLIKQDVLENGILIQPVLLGDHRKKGQDGEALGHPYFKDVLGRIVGEWPSSAFGNFGPPGSGGDLQDLQTEINLPWQTPRQVFARVLRRSLGNQRGPYEKKVRTKISGMSGTGVLPNGRDRLAPAKKQIGAPGTIWQLPGETKARLPEKQKRAHVYLDVSGSMSEIIASCVGLLLPYMADGRVEVFQFSTVVRQLSYKNVRNGYLRTTGGTNIDCVLDHLLKTEPAVRKVLILTDGATGVPRDDFTAQVLEQNIRVHIVLPSESPYEDDLRQIARSFTVLPPLI